MKNKNILKYISCGTFACLYLIVAIISLICSTEFFALAHGGIMKWILAIGFEIGAMSCLMATLILPKKKLGLVWFMFIVLTLFQCMGNMYAAFVHLDNFKDWIDMFNLADMELMAQKRVLAGISGIILPLIALGFIKIMVDVLQNGKIDLDKKEDESNYPNPENEKSAESVEKLDFDKNINNSQNDKIDNQQETVDSSNSDGAQPKSENRIWNNNVIKEEIG